MAKRAVETYLDLMWTIRRRFEALEACRELGSLQMAEQCALNLRKIVEGIVFGCIVAAENGLEYAPRDVTGAYNAQEILRKLEKKGISVLPSPSVYRPASIEEQKVWGVTAVVEGQIERRLSVRDIEQIYWRCHRWLHEPNPYLGMSAEKLFEVHRHSLVEDADRVRRFIERHMIGIKGRSFFCTIWDSVDGQTKVLPLEKEAQLPGN